MNRGPFSASQYLNILDEIIPMGGASAPFEDVQEFGSFLRPVDYYPVPKSAPPLTKTSFCSGCRLSSAEPTKRLSVERGDEPDPEHPHCRGDRGNKSATDNKREDDPDGSPRNGGCP